MNERGVEALVQAAMAGAPQIKGALWERNGDGRCAMGVLYDDAHGNEPFLYFAISMGGVAPCPECKLQCGGEYGLILHLNDDHGWDFLAIARKLGPAVELPDADEARREGGDHA